MKSLAARLAALPEDQRNELLRNMTPEAAEELLFRWEFWARQDQKTPKGDWRVWLILAGRGWGKQLADDTPIPTPSGWATMGELKPGDRVFDEAGRPCNVTAKFSSHEDEQYRIGFSDGSFLDAGASHQWITWNHRARRTIVGSKEFPADWATWSKGKHGPKIRTTSDIVSTLKYCSRHYNEHSIPCCASLELPHADLPCDPYSMGRRIILEEKLSQADRDAYTRASAEQRMSMLHGLMDASPESSRSTVEFSNSDKAVTDLVFELLVSLGQAPERSNTGQTKAGNSRIIWRPSFSPYRSNRRSASVITDGGKMIVSRQRYIVSAERIRPVPMSCITVDSPNSLYLAGKSMIPTHNTRTGSEWVRSIACGKTPLAPGKCRRIAIVGETAADCRDVLAQGDSGILSVHPKDFRPVYRPSTRSLTWPNGTQAFFYNGTEPDQLRGPQHDALWIDEIAKYREAQSCWDQAQFGLRLGNSPQQIITTTPRPIPVIKNLLAESHEPDSGIVVTRGSTFDNRANLAGTFLEAVERRYSGSRLGRQELDGEVLDDVPGALWSRKVIDENRRRLSDELPAMQRIIVSIDPAAKASKDGDDTSETGIAVVGLGVDGRGYLIDDRSCRLGPAGWAAVAVSAYDYYEGDAIVAEINQGGDMVEQVIKAVRPSIKVIKVRATRGKVLRAEPISALYSQGRISHVGSFPLLEDQMMQFTSFGIEGDGDADRVDAVVHGFTELFPRLIGKEEPKRRQNSGYVGRANRSDVTGY